MHTQTLATIAMGTLVAILIALVSLPPILSFKSSAPDIVREYASFVPASGDKTPRTVALGSEIREAGTVYLGHFGMLRVEPETVLRIDTAIFDPEKKALDHAIVELVAGTIFATSLTVDASIAVRSHSLEMLLRGSSATLHTDEAGTKISVASGAVALTSDDVFVGTLGSGTQVAVDTQSATRLQTQEDFARAGWLHTQSRPLQQTEYRALSSAFTETSFHVATLIQRATAARMQPLFGASFVDALVIVPAARERLTMQYFVEAMQGDSEQLHAANMRLRTFDHLVPLTRLAAADYLPETTRAQIADLAALESELLHYTTLDPLDKSAQAYQRMLLAENAAAAHAVLETLDTVTRDDLGTIALSHAHILADTNNTLVIAYQNLRGEDSKNNAQLAALKLALSRDLIQKGNASAAEKILLAVDHTDTHAQTLKSELLRRLSFAKTRPQGTPFDLTAYRVWQEQNSARLHSTAQDTPPPATEEPLADETPEMPALEETPAPTGDAPVRRTPRTRAE